MRDHWRCAQGPLGNALRCSPGTSAGQPLPASTGHASQPARQGGRKGALSGGEARWLSPDLACCPMRRRVSRSRSAGCHRTARACAPRTCFAAQPTGAHRQTAESEHDHGDSSSLARLFDALHRARRQHSLGLPAEGSQPASLWGSGIHNLRDAYIGTSLGRWEGSSDAEPSVSTRPQRAHPARPRPEWGQASCRSQPDRRPLSARADQV